MQVCRINDDGSLNMHRPMWVISDEELVANHNFYWYDTNGFNPEYDTHNSPAYIIEENRIIKCSYIRDLEKKRLSLIERRVAKLKQEIESKISLNRFEHAGLKFSCSITSQINYMGLKTLINSGIKTFPAKCWDEHGKEYFIQDMAELTMMIAKLSAMIYPLREAYNRDEDLARAMSIEELEQLELG